MDDEQEPMIRVMNACKWFGQTVALNDLTLTVPTGGIYALLGPSGCGKTILLSCVVGLRQLDDGVIKCGISRKNQIGYMPQDIGLSGFFTVRETLTFYGRLYGIKNDNIKKKIEDLNSLFKLPNLDLRIEQLSGGEKRRVSLAVTFFHDAKLLLLDEPTVGIDPVLSKNIWTFLESLARRGTTILITTHYIEEARGAHRIGMMREGKLLIEDTPSNVMSSQNADSLENAFLSLCIAQLADKANSKMETLIKRRKKPEQFEKIYVPGKSFDVNRFFAQLVKNFTSMKRNSMVIGLLLCLPFFLSFLLSEAYGITPMPTLAFVSQELPFGEEERTCLVIEDQLVAESLNCSLPVPFSCGFLEQLKKSTLPTIYSSKEEGFKAVKTNKAWGVLLLPSNFTSSLSDLIFNGLAYLDEDRLNEALDDAQIDIHLDSSNYIMHQWTKKLITERYRDFLKYLIAACGLPENFSSSLKIMDPIFGQRDPPLSESILPAFVSAWCFYFTLLYTSGAIMLEKLAGLVERHTVAGMTYWERVSAHTIVQFALITFQKAIMLAIFYGVYRHPLLGNFGLLVGLLYAIEAVGVAYGIFVTEATSDDRFIAFNSMVGLNTIFIVGGVIWPLEGSHPAFHAVVWIFPVSPAVDAYKSIAFKGQGLESWNVVKGFVSCFVWVFLFAIGTTIANRSKRKRLF